MMRKFFYFLLFSVLTITPLKEAKSSFWARSYIVMEQNSGQILEGNQLQLERSVASISKVMTAVLAVESDDFFRVVTIVEKKYLLRWGVVSIFKKETAFLFVI